MAAIITSRGRVRVRMGKVLVGSSIEIGIDAGWDRVRYFSEHDLTVTSGGIGRAGSSNLGGIWDYDTCGFWLDLNPFSPVGSGDFALDYESNWGGVGWWHNKHGIGWWPDSAEGGSIASPDGFAGAWNGDYYLFLSASEIPSAEEIAPTSESGAYSWRRVQRIAGIWSILDGPSWPADGSLGRATWPSSLSSIAARLGFRIGPDGRIRRIIFTAL